MNGDIGQLLFSIGISIATLGGGVWFGIQNRVWKKEIAKVQAKIPDPPSDETLAQREQELRDKINRQVGVQLDAAQKEIKALQRDNEANKKEIVDLKKQVENKDVEIATLNKQVSRLEREHEEEQTARETYQERAHTAEKSNVELMTEMKVYRVAMELVQQTIARPIQITLTLDGMVAKEVKADTPVLPIPETPQETPPVV